jgi:hypothetical protein
VKLLDKSIIHYISYRVAEKYRKSIKKNCG